MLVDLVLYVSIDRAVSMTRVAYDASFAKLVSLDTYCDSRRSGNQRILRYLFRWLGSFSNFCFSITRYYLGAFGNGLGISFHRRVVKPHQGSRSTSDPMVPHLTDRYRISACFLHETHTHREKELV